jgi:hypothetical protein
MSPSFLPGKSNVETEGITEGQRSTDRKQLCSLRRKDIPVAFISGMSRSTATILFMGNVVPRLQRPFALQGLLQHWFVEDS